MCVLWGEAQRLSAPRLRASSPMHFWGNLTVRGGKLSVRLSFNFLKNPSSRWLHIWRVCYQGPEEVQRRVWSSLDDNQACDSSHLVQVLSKSQVILFWASQVKSENVSGQVKSLRDLSIHMCWLSLTNCYSACQRSVTSNYISISIELLSFTNDVLILCRGQKSSCKYAFLPAVLSKISCHQSSYDLVV